MLLLTAASAKGEGQVASITPVLVAPSPVVCLIDGAFGYNVDTPRLCFRTAPDALESQNFWTGFETVVPAPQSIEGLSAAFEIRSGTGLIGEREVDLSSEAVHMLNTCWARIEQLQHNNLPIPAAPCVQ